MYIRAGTYSPSREKLIHLLADIRNRLHLLKQLLTPDPPVALTKHIDVIYPNYKVSLARINQLWATPLKETMLGDVQKWIDTSVCTVMEEYKLKEEEGKCGIAIQ